jgi:hypothetical protein
MRGRISAVGVVLLGALAGMTSGLGCGSEDSVQTLAVETVQEDAPPPLKKLALCPAVGRYLVCGKDGKTYSDICAAGGLGNVGHSGACADFACNGGAVCGAGFTCQSFGGSGGPIDQCVAD